MCDVYLMLADALRERDVLKARIVELEGELTQNNDEEYRRYCAAAEIQARSATIGLHSATPDEPIPPPRPFPILSEPPTRQPEVNPNGPTA